MKKEGYRQPPSPKEVHILSQRIPFRICMHTKTNRSDVLDTSEKQPWRSHPQGCKEEEARRSKFQERQF
jgi:hypothetical protein